MNTSQRQGFVELARGYCVFDAVSYVRLCELCGNADAVHDGALIRRTVADDAGAAYAEQLCSAVFGVVETLFEGGESLA